MVKDPVAAVEVIAETVEGKRLTISVRIGRPYEETDGNWACPVEMAPIYGQLADIRGVDSFHALWLGCSLVLKLLGHFKAAGGKLYGEDGAEFPVEAYLSGLGGKLQ
jgi:uncharacterized protein DUF6968